LPVARMALAGVLLLCGWTLAAPAWAHADVRGSDQRMLRAVNAVRAEHGLHRLRAAPKLGRSAGRYARWMLRHDYFGHLNRIRASGIFSLLGENLAWHSGRRPRVGLTVRQWMGSAAHRALILHRSFRWVGAGMARGRLGSRMVTAWVLHFGG
jgi:uncharacterized protein YkwD